MAGGAAGATAAAAIPSFGVGAAAVLPITAPIAIAGLGIAGAGAVMNDQLRKKPHSEFNPIGTFTDMF